MGTKEDTKESLFYGGNFKDFEGSVKHTWTMIALRLRTKFSGWEVKIVGCLIYRNCPGSP